MRLQSYNIFFYCTNKNGYFVIYYSDGSSENIEIPEEELMEDENCSYEEAADWIDYNTIRSLPYAGENGPIIMFSILE